MAPPLSKKVVILFFKSLKISPEGVAKILEFFSTPVDFGKEYKGKPILGRNKTWRGVMVGIIIGILTVVAQYFLYQVPFFQKISFFDYQKINIFLFGFLISFGAVFGDLLFSSFKRRLNIQPGQKWIPFDQIDYVIGSFIFLGPFFKIDFVIWITVLILTFFLHVLVNQLGFWLKLTENRW